MTALQAILAFLAATVIPTTVALTKWFLNRKDRLVEQSIPRLLERVHLVYEVIAGLREAFDAERVLVLRLSNCGEIPRPGVPLFVSVLYEATTGESVRRRWVKQRINSWYTDLMFNVANSGQLQLITEDLPPEALIKGTYQEGGITNSWVIPIGIAPSSFYFLSIGLSNEPRDLTATEQEEIRAAVNVLRRALLSQEPAK